MHRAALALAIQDRDCKLHYSHYVFQYRGIGIGASANFLDARQKGLVNVLAIIARRVSIRGGKEK